MAVDLKIRWDGNAPGLPEHRISVAAFGEPLTLLLTALRRIATQMVRTAMEAEAPQTGRFANLARQLDIEIVNVEGNSAGVNAVVSFSAEAADAAVFPDLPTRAATHLLEAIERETKSQPTSSAVRKYLRSLPGGVHRQVYEVFDGGKSAKRVEIGEVELKELPPELPVLHEMEGSIVGVGFEPGRNEVRIRTEENVGATLAASAESVERALQYRHEKIRTLSVHDEKKSRLISLTKASDPKFRFNPEAVEEYVFKRWDTLLARLAK